MSCASCVAKVEEAAMTVPGVASATVNLLAETATVRLARDARLDAPPADPEDVAAAVASYGYAAEVIDTSGLAFRVGGMVCASCPPRIEMAIGRVKGVARVEANSLLGKVVVQYNAAVVGARMIKAAIEALREGRVRPRGSSGRRPCRAVPRRARHARRRARCCSARLLR